MRATFSHKKRREEERAGVEPIAEENYQFWWQWPGVCSALPRGPVLVSRCRVNTGFADELLRHGPFPEAGGAAGGSAAHRPAGACRGRGWRRRAAGAGGHRAEGGEILL